MIKNLVKTLLFQLDSNDLGMTTKRKRIEELEEEINKMKIINNPIMVNESEVKTEIFDDEEVIEEIKQEFSYILNTDYLNNEKRLNDIIRDKLNTGEIKQSDMLFLDDLQRKQEWILYLNLKPFVGRIVRCDDKWDIDYNKWKSMFFNDNLVENLKSKTKKITLEDLYLLRQTNRFNWNFKVLGDWIWVLIEDIIDNNNWEYNTIISENYKYDFDNFQKFFNFLEEKIILNSYEWIFKNDNFWINNIINNVWDKLTFLSFLEENYNILKWLLDKVTQGEKVDDNIEIIRFYLFMILVVFRFIILRIEERIYFISNNQFRVNEDEFRNRDSKHIFQLFVENQLYNWDWLKYVREQGLKLEEYIWYAASHKISYNNLDDIFDLLYHINNLIFIYYYNNKDE